MGCFEPGTRVDVDLSLSLVAFEAYARRETNWLGWNLGLNIEWVDREVLGDGEGTRTVGREVNVRDAETTVVWGVEGEDRVAVSVLRRCNVERKMDIISMGLNTLKCI